MTGGMQRYAAFVAITTAGSLAGCGLLDEQAGTIPEPSPYEATEHGFAVDFPGTPKIDLDAMSVPDAGNIPMTTYQVELPRGTGVHENGGSFAVSVADLELAGLSAKGVERTVLDGAVTGSASEVDGKIVSRSSDGTFRGLPQGRSVVTGTRDGQKFTLRYLCFLKAEKLFQMVTVNADKKSFNAFVKSFRFTGK